MGSMRKGIASSLSQLCDQNFVIFEDNNETEVVIKKKVNKKSFTVYRCDHGQYRNNTVAIYGFIVLYPGLESPNVINYVLAYFYGLRINISFRTMERWNMHRCLFGCKRQQSSMLNCLGMRCTICACILYTTY